MIEIPEAEVLRGQLASTITDRQVVQTISAQSPHKFAWYSGDPQQYTAYLTGAKVGDVNAYGGMVEICMGEYALVFSDGVNLRYHPVNTELPARHQLLLTFEDGSSLSAVVLMYGGLLCEKAGGNTNPYYLAAREKPNPLTPAFDEPYFQGLISSARGNLPLKAFLATEQRIPGLGNGVLQDILFNAGLHPRRKLSDVDGGQAAQLYHSIKTTLETMVLSGGRDTEYDLFGKMGGYITRMSRNTLGKPCPVCGADIQRASFLGGSIYFCPECQAA